MNVDFSLRVLQADASTPRVPFREAPGFGTADSDKISTIPLPAGGGLEGQPGYQCPGDDSDCHLIVVDRSQGKLYEVYHANYADGALSAIGLSLWNLNRIYPPSGEEINAPVPMPQAYPSLPCSSMPTNSPQGTSATPFALFFPTREFERTFLCIQLRTPVLRSGPLPLRPWALTSASRPLTTCRD